MLAALVVLGLVAGLLLPNFQRWHDRTQERVNTGAIWMQLQKLFVRAALLGNDFELTDQSAGTLLADGQPALQLPPGWKVDAKQRLLIHASGYCEKARLDFKGPDNRLRFDILSPDCEMTNQVITTDKP
jgi:type II secretory pathway pseudopilin PulG